MQNEFVESKRFTLFLVSLFACTKDLIKSKGDQKAIFQLGDKSLALLIKLSESKHLQASYQVKHV